MIGFLIKKSFYDLWDNLLKALLLNFGFMASLLIPIFLPSLFSTFLLELAALFAGILWCTVYLAAAAFSLRAVSDYGSFGFADFFANLKAYWHYGIVAGVFVCAAYVLYAMVLPFYLSLNSVQGLFLASMVLWSSIAVVLALQFFFAIRGRLDTKLPDVIKKCFIILVDNPGFCVYVFFHSTVMLLLSVCTAFLFPGVSGVLLFLDEGLRLRLLKYDWLDLNQSANRRKIPWNVLLTEEREKTGDRSLRSFIFPWKD